MHQLLAKPKSLCLGLILVMASTGWAKAATRGDEAKRQVLIRDITTIAGVRDNQLVGYGIVVGLNGTGDRSQTQFTTQTLANAMRRMGVQVTPTNIRINNVAAVFVTASLPPFTTQGMKLDVTVSSVGDAKSLEGGVLLSTALQGPDGLVYAMAQGGLTLGGYSAGGNGNTKSVNHATVARVPAGAIVERDTAIDLARMKRVSLMLRNPDFSAACMVASAINHEFQRDIAHALDSRRVDVDVVGSAADSVPQLIARIHGLAIEFQPPAKVVINERTGTIVMGGDVKLSPVSVLHGNLTIEIATTFSASQPAPMSRGKTTTVPEVSLRAENSPARSLRLEQGASVEELITGLHAMGATARDIVAILQAIKSAGGLEAELEVM